MKNLEFLKVNDDSLALILKDESGKEYSLSYSKELQSGVTNLSLTSSSATRKQSSPSDLTPREIQQRIRSGMSAEEINKRFKTPLERIQKYATTVEHEKTLIIEQFQNLPARSEKRGLKLIEVINEYFDENDVDRHNANWIAMRNGRDPWEIRVYFKRGTAALVALWSWDPKELIISEDNLLAKEITQYYLDAKDDAEVTHLGNKAQNRPNINASFANTKTTGTFSQNMNLQKSNLRNINISSGLRLRELEKLRDELDHDLENINETRKDIESEAKKVSRSDNKPTNSKPVLQVVQNPDEVPDDLEINSKPTTTAGDDTEPKDIEEKDEVATKNDTSFNLSDKNITGKIRAKWARTSSKRKNVPSWDEVMLSNFEQSESNDDEPIAA